MWSLFDFLMKGHLGKHGSFIREFEQPVLDGDTQAKDRLIRKIRPFILRRLKKEVAKDLPEKVHMEEWCQLTEEQRALYGQIQESLGSPVQAQLEKGEQVSYATGILPILTKLKQVCDHPALVNGIMEPIRGRSEKFDLALERIQEIRGRKEAVVLFSHFLGTLDLFETAFKASRISYIRIDGSTSNLKRQAYIDSFNAGGEDVALCSIQACGYGITLTAANHVIHVDRWWNPAVEDQATDRVHRIGQEKTVYVYKIIVQGTLEEKIAILLERKRNLADQVIGEAIQREIKFTREELLELLKPLE